jgi:hypothetical protein
MVVANNVAHRQQARFDAGMAAGELQSPGTGPFFGEKTHFAGKRLPENMDLSPSRRDFAVLLGMAV